MGVQDRIRVAVLFGGTSTEHDVSVCSGLNVLDSLDGVRHVALPVYIDPDGGWHFGFRPQPPDLEVPEESGSAATRPRSLAPGPPRGERGVLETLQAGDVLDVAFIALHGPGGEDGAVQGLLTLAGVPFTGSGVLASALAMDKERTKQLLAAVGVPVAPHRLVTESELKDPTALRRDVEERIGHPCVVKPVCGGSSFGTRVIERPDDLEQALREAFTADRRVLVEAFVAGTEVTCGVLGGGPLEPAQPLPLTEIVPVADTFFDFRAKYTVGACEEITPARVDRAVAAEVQRLAVLAHQTLGCEGMSRTDFILDDGGPRLLETNTIPGLTRTSLLPQGAAAAGISFAELVERLVQSALVRARRGR